MLKVKNHIKDNLKEKNEGINLDEVKIIENSPNIVNQEKQKIE